MGMPLAGRLTPASIPCSAIKKRKKKPHTHTQSNDNNTTPACWFLLVLTWTNNGLACLWGIAASGTAQAMLTWITAALSHKEQRALMDTWRNASKNTMFEEWLRNWWGQDLLRRQRIQEEQEQGSTCAHHPPVSHSHSHSHPHSHPHAHAHPHSHSHTHSHTCVSEDAGAAGGAPGQDAQEDPLRMVAGVLPRWAAQGRQGRQGRRGRKGRERDPGARAQGL